MNVFIILATHDRLRHYEVLTFDDGYRDNLSVASDPRRNNAPFTFRLTPLHDPCTKGEGCP